MHRDQAGLPITSQSAETVEHFDRAVNALLEYRLTASQHAKSALGADPEFAMGLCLRGYLLLQLGTNQVRDKVHQTSVLATQAAATGTPRERHHAAALQHWLEGEIHKACARWEAILIEAPGDLLALRLHHFMSFWLGRRSALRDQPAATLGRVDEHLPGYGFILGMFAFGLEECGDYARAELLGRRAVESNEDDLWALHAVAHVLEMQCRQEEGTQWLNQPAGVWADRNPFKDHVWWHTALFWLELGDTERVLTLYDAEIKIDESGFYLDLQNGASMLMRLELLGVDVGDRWNALADLAETRLDDHVMPFTDIHFMLSLVGAGRLDSARAYLESLREFANSASNDAARVTATLTVPVAAALLDYGEDRYDSTVDILRGLRQDLAPLGGSQAQQDIFAQLLIESALRSGQRSLAHHLLSERCMLRPGNKWAQSRLETVAA